jgi:diaminopimelate decarboxylase
VGQGLLSRIAAAVGTPVYVYDADAIRRQYAALSAALAGVPHRVHYSVKANANLAVLGLLRGLGAGADIVSGGELARALAAGFRGADIVFSGVGKNRTELTAALQAGVGLINLESEGEFELLRRLARGRPAPTAVGIRVNPDVTTETHPYTQTGGAGMKFGVPLDQVVPLARHIAAEPGLRLVSVGMHIGSQIADPAPYREGAGRLEELVGTLRSAGIDTLASVDVGGGLGISYRCGEGLEVTAFAAAVAPLARATGLPLLVEPGRFLVGNAGYLLTRVLYRKHSGGRWFVITDAGMNDLLRPSLYQAYHEVVVIDGAAEAAEAAGDVVGNAPPASAAPAAPAAPVDIVGPNCESGDFLALDRTLPGAGPGALLGVLGAGAYGFGMSFQYNSRPRAPEVLMDGGRYAVIRARETADDLMRGERVDPHWRDA